MIGVARPTRGIEFSESAHSIDRELENVPHVSERSWDEPIPDSFNSVTQLLLNRPWVESILYVEEDVVIPKHSVEAMIEADADVAHVPYYLKLGPKNPSYRRARDGSVLWVGLGCTLVKRKVFELLNWPWFKIGYTTATVHEGSSCREKVLRLVKVSVDYGSQDVYFCWMVREAGLRIAVIENMMCDHLVLESLGAPLKNDGCHKIRRVLERGEDYRGRTAGNEVRVNKQAVRVPVQNKA